MMRRWIGISLLMHAAVILPLMLPVFSTPPPKDRVVKLDLELFNMLSDREVEEQRTAGVPELPPGHAPKPKPEPSPEEPPVQLPDEPMPEPVAAVELPAELMEEPPEPFIESPVAIPVAGQVAATSSSDIAGGSGVFLPSTGTGAGIGGGGSGGRDAADQRGETIRRGRAGDADPLSMYTSRVARRLQSNLVYPEKMRRKGIEAVTTIIFTVTGSGEIKKDSLKVRKSSGYAEMDDNALKAARASAPFDEPPKEMTLVIDVAFEVGRSRR
jgi:protein TonB